MNALHRKAFGGLLLLCLAMAALLFGPAWTLDFWQAWTFLSVYFAASVAITLYLMKQDPALLQRRMRGGPAAEKEPVQKIIMSVASVGFIGLVVIPALDHRFNWSHMPPATALAGDGLVVLGWIVIFFVFRENTFTSSTIELAPDQKVISTGPYAWVRHPIYLAFLAMLIATGLLVSDGVKLILPVLLYLAGSELRIASEEAELAKKFPEGYAIYRSRTRRRYLPGLR